jgi:hypothetical protein
MRTTIEVVVNCVLNTYNPFITVINRYAGLFIYKTIRNSNLSISPSSVNNAGWCGSSQTSTGVELMNAVQPAMKTTNFTYRGTGEGSAGAYNAGWCGSSQTSTGVELMNAVQPAMITTNNRQPGEVVQEARS